MQKNHDVSKMFFTIDKNIYLDNQRNQNLDISMTYLRRRFGGKLPQNYRTYNRYRLKQKQSTIINDKPY